MTFQEDYSDAAFWLLFWSGVLMMWTVGAVLNVYDMWREWKWRRCHTTNAHALDDMTPIAVGPTAPRRIGTIRHIVTGNDKLSYPRTGSQCARAWRPSADARRSPILRDGVSLLGHANHYGIHDVPSSHGEGG